MKVLMYGFGSGNNIEPWLEFYENNHVRYHLSYVCRKFQFNRDHFPHIQVVETGSLYFIGFAILRHIRSAPWDVVYIQGLYDYLIVLQLLLFARCKLRVVNIWNNRNFRKGSPENRKFWQVPLYRIIYRLTNRFYFTWYGTYSDFEHLFPSQKEKMFIQPWGIRNRIIEEEPVVQSDFVRNYLSGLREDELFLFWPENMAAEEHIDLLVMALAQLDDRRNFRVLIFCGHQKTENDYSRKLRSLIRENGLDCIDLVLGEYLPFADIMALWQRADLTIKLSTKDQLSNGIIEAMFFKTPIILNNWMPYQKLADAGFHVNLTEMEVRPVANCLKTLVDNIHKDRDFYLKQGKVNSRIIREKFNFDKNIGLLMKDLEKVVSAS